MLRKINRNENTNQNWYHVVAEEFVGVPDAELYTTSTWVFAANTVGSPAVAVAGEVTLHVTVQAPSKDNPTSLTVTELEPPKLP